MILKTIKNQWGQEIPTEDIQWDGGPAWVRRTLTCHSSELLGLGTCACVSHNPYHYEDLTSSEVREIISKEIISLTEEEERILSSRSWQDEFLEFLWVKCCQLTQEEVEDWLSLSYRIGNNPLPALRKKVKESGVEADVVYASEPDQGSRPNYCSEKKTIIVWVDNDRDASLEFYTPQE